MVIMISTPNEKKALAINTDTKKIFSDESGYKLWGKTDVEQRSLIYVQKVKDFESTIKTLKLLGYTDVVKLL